MIHGIIGITFTNHQEIEEQLAKPFKKPCFLALFPRQATDFYAYYGIVIIVHIWICMLR